jgi:pimeloyl-ACP methyl ester carboxylesterase
LLYKRLFNQSTQNIRIFGLLFSTKRTEWTRKVMMEKETLLNGNKMTLSDGRILSYATYGPQDGIPVIGFHGMPGSRLMMKVLEPAAVLGGIRLIAPERPGYGRSSPNSQGGLLSYQRDIQDLVDKLGYSHFGVIGVSGGGPYALACAHELSKRIISTEVVSGIGPLTLPNSLQGMVRTNRIMFMIGRYSPPLSGLLLTRLIKLTLPSMEKYVLTGASPNPAISPQVFEIITADQREAVSFGGHGVAFDMQTLWRPWGFKLEDIQPRVYLWHGEDDNLAPARLAHEIAMRLPNCEAEFLVGEGHTSLLLEHSLEFLNLFNQ